MAMIRSRNVRESGLFVNTNTGYFGLQIRPALRDDKSLRTWIYHTTLNREDMGVTWVRRKPIQLLPVPLSMPI